MDRRVSGTRTAESLGEVLSKEIRTSVASYFSPVLAVVNDVARTIREEGKAQPHPRRPGEGDRTTAK